VIRAVLGPLARGTTYRRGVYLLLGGVLALPYALLFSVFWQLLVEDGRHRLLVACLLAVAAAVAIVPAFLSGTRAVEIAAVRWLLRVDLPDPPPSGEASRETRLRAALWFAVHLTVGSAVGIVLLTALPLALTFLVYEFAGSPTDVVGPPLNLFDPDDTLLLTLVGVALLVLAGYAVAGLGALAATMAPVLLGPSPTERIAALELAATRLAHRNRLARELHDSVGHALTVTTLQAAAAREVLDADPAFARRALAAIEDAGRAALGDLDRVLGVLRDGEAAALSPARTLADLDRLLSEVRATGVPVTVEVTGPVDELPATISREGYRIVQESLTNALRHAGPVPVTLRLRVDGSALSIFVTNGVAGDRSAGDGRGLVGMRERVTLLGGSLDVGPGGDGWRVAARLPVEGTR
jgi:signal transduction histidine kinase